MRNRFFLAADILLLAGLPFLTVAARYETFTWPPVVVHAVVVYALFALPLRLGSAYAKGLYRCMWRHASVTELERILFAGAIAGIGTFLFGTVGITALGLSATRLPYSSLLLDALLALALLAAPRMVARIRGAQVRGSVNE